MSVTINTGELKFSVFGKGFENTRNDSGEGGVTYEKRIGYGAGTACLDNTNTYFWITQNQGQYPFNYLGKGRISDLEPVEITSALPTNVQTYLYHPSNVENNYGVAFQNFGNNADVYIFNLTTDEIYHHFTIATGSFYMNDTADCILVGEDFYFALRGSANAKVYKLDVSTGTFGETASLWFNNGGGGGFVDNNMLYGFNNPVWFSDSAYRCGFTKSGSTQWDRTSQGSGSGAWSRCKERSLCANGYFYLPCNLNNKWCWGKFNGSSGGDFETPSPISTFGVFDANPQNDDWHVYYTDGRESCAYVHASWGMLVVDIGSDKVNYVTSEYWKPLAVSKKYVVAVDRSVNNTYIFKYR